MENKQETLPEGFLLAGRYEVVRCIGIGGFGTTYLCQDKRLDRKAAVKEYFPRQWAEREGAYVSVQKSSMAEAFRLGMQSVVREAQIMAEFVETPHVVTLWVVLQANDTVYLAMEYLDGCLWNGRRSSLSADRPETGRRFKPPGGKGRKGEAAGEMGQAFGAGLRAFHSGAHRFCRGIFPPDSRAYVTGEKPGGRDE